MKFEMLKPSDQTWNQVIEYAESCSWRAGKFLARDMRNRIFSDWERVIVALEDGEICGYCTVAKTDCIPEVPYTPYIGYVIVGEAYRGNRISEKMIKFPKRI